MDNPGYIWIHPDKHVYTFGRAASGGREGDAHISYLAQSRKMMLHPVPFSTISSNGDDPGQCGHAENVICTHRYSYLIGCNVRDLVL